MGFNLISLIKSYFDDKVVNLVSRAVNNEDEQTLVAINAIIPGILNKLSKITSSKLAAEALFQSIRNQNESILSNLTKELIDDKHIKLAHSGSFYTNSLLGLRGIESLVEGVSQTSGMNQQSSSALLGILMPIVLSAIKSKLIEKNSLTSVGVIIILDEQEEWIAESLPNNFFNEEDQIEKEVVQLNSPPQDNQSESSLMTKVLPLLLLPAILFVAYYFFYNKPDIRMMLPSIQTVFELNTNSKFSIEERKSLKELSFLLGSVENLLSEVTDRKSAKKRLTGLEKEVKSLNLLSQKIQGMSQEAKLKAASLFKSKIPQMQASVDRIHKIPGGTVTIKPVMNQLIKISVDGFI